MSAATAEWLPSIEREISSETNGSHASRIQSVAEVPSIFECGAREVQYLVEPLLPAGAVVGLTGDSGSGKSTLATKLSAVAGALEHPVLILDRENPLAVVADRYERLGMTDGPQHKHWGGWLDCEAPTPGTALVMKWVAACSRPPLVVVDSLVAFLRGDENSAQEMRAFLDQARRLADMGAVVVILHHTGKSESAQEFRGSSDFKAGIDCGFHVFNFSSDMRLDVLRVRAFKSRFGFTGEIVYRYADGRMLRDENPSAPAQTNNEQLTAILRLHPGVQSGEFDKFATARGIGRQAAREFLNGGLLARSIRCEMGPKNGRRFFLSGGPDAE